MNPTKKSARKPHKNLELEIIKEDPLENYDAPFMDWAVNKVQNIPGSNFSRQTGFNLLKSKLAQSTLLIVPTANLDIHESEYSEHTNESKSPDEVKEQPVSQSLDLTSQHSVSSVSTSASEGSVTNDSLENMNNVPIPKRTRNLLSSNPSNFDGTIANLNIQDKSASEVIQLSEHSTQLSSKNSSPRSETSHQLKNWIDQHEAIMRDSDYSKLIRCNPENLTQNEDVVLTKLLAKKKKVLEAIVGLEIRDAKSYVVRALIKDYDQDKALKNSMTWLKDSGFGELQDDYVKQEFLSDSLVQKRNAEKSISSFWKNRITKLEKIKVHELISIEEIKNILISIEEIKDKKIHEGFLKRLAQVLYDTVLHKNILESKKQGKNLEGTIVLLTSELIILKKLPKDRFPEELHAAIDTLVKDFISLHDERLRLQKDIIAHEVVQDKSNEIQSLGRLQSIESLKKRMPKNWPEVTIDTNWNSKISKEIVQKLVKHNLSGHRDVHREDLTQDYEDVISTIKMKTLPVAHPNASKFRLKGK